jgi:hypothetical protein
MRRVLACFPTTEPFLLVSEAVFRLREAADGNVVLVPFGDPLGLVTHEEAADKEIGVLDLSGSERAARIPPLSEVMAVLGSKPTKRPLIIFLPTADRRPPTADRRPPTADRRPPTADRRPPTASSAKPSLGGIHPQPSPSPEPLPGASCLLPRTRS